MDNLQAIIEEAAARIGPYVAPTPLIRSQPLSDRAGCEVFLKLENLQPAGSFKVRGALNRMLALTPRQRRAGVVAASTGNHGAAVAYGMHLLGIGGTIFVPEGAAPAKLRLIEGFGGRIAYHGTDCAVTEEHARAYARRNGMVYISPYNDPHVVAGQGTIGAELMAQQAGLDAVFAAVGGGGLIAGLAGYLKVALPGAVAVYGCSPERSAAMAASVAAGRVVAVESRPTLSDATAGGVEAGTITLEPCRRFVDDFVLVTEAEIEAALRLLLTSHGLLVEGAAGVVLAAFLRTAERLQGQRVALVISGGNVGRAVMQRLICSHPEGA